MALSSESQFVLWIFCVCCRLKFKSSIFFNCFAASNLYVYLWTTRLQLMSNRMLFSDNSQLIFRRKPFLELVGVLLTGLLACAIKICLFAQISTSPSYGKINWSTFVVIVLRSRLSMAEYWVQITHATYLTMRMEVEVAFVAQIRIFLHFNWRDTRSKTSDRFDSISDCFVLLHFLMNLPPPTHFKDLSFSSAIKPDQVSQVDK